MFDCVAWYRYTTAFSDDDDAAATILTVCNECRVYNELRQMLLKCNTCRSIWILCNRLQNNLRNLKFQRNAIWIHLTKLSIRLTVYKLLLLHTHTYPQYIVNRMDRRENFVSRCNYEMRCPNPWMPQMQSIHGTHTTIYVPFRKLAFALCQLTGRLSSVLVILATGWEEMKKKIRTSINPFFVGLFFNWRVKKSFEVFTAQKSTNKFSNCAIPLRQHAIHINIGGVYGGKMPIRCTLVASVRCNQISPAANICHVIWSALNATLCQLVCK